MSKTEIVIGMAGQGKRFLEAGFRESKPFIDVVGKPMIARVIENLLPISNKFTFLCRLDVIERMASVVKSYPIEANVIPVWYPTEGAVSTVLLAQNHIDRASPVIIAACDQLLDYDPAAWIEHRRKGTGNHHSVWVFGPANHPKWSYSRIENKKVVEVAEKNPISEWANCGLYYWHTWGNFVDSAESMILQNKRVNGEFYVAPVFQEAINKGFTVRPFFVKEMHGLGTPEDYDKFIREEYYD